MTPTAPDQNSFVSARASAWLLLCIITGAVALRTLAIAVLDQSFAESADPLSYFLMAKSLVLEGELVDQYGNRAFMSAGYPLLLAPFFAAFGTREAVALGVNLMLTAVSVWLIYRLTLALSGRREAALLAALVFAVWLAGIWNATLLAKENLSTPLFLALALCALEIARGKRPLRVGALAGLLWGASLLTGGSALPLCLGVAVALIILWRQSGRFFPAFKSGLCFLAGAAVVLSPWLYATDQILGRPVLTTNAAFNLYIGNNPAATGKFVGIKKTPMAPRWETVRVELGEIANADRLQRAALKWMADNPARVAELTALKLVYFWEPSIPDRQDFAASRAAGSIRVFEVVQYASIVVLGLFAFRSRLIASGDKWIFAVLLLGFWLVHAIIYIIARYRDPAMPLLIAMASIPVADWLRRSLERRLSHDK